MITQTVTVTVCLEPDKRDPKGYKLLHLKVGERPPVQLARDVPPPRRLASDLVDAALDSLRTGG